MARILIHLEDLARLARRFDAAADELARSVRRLSRDRQEVRLNPADRSFPYARFVERSVLVEAKLRRLAADFVVDAGLMARTVDDAGLDGEGDWTAGFRSAAGLAASVGIGGAGRGIASVTSVVAGLDSLGALTPSTAEVAPASVLPVGAGGLFALASTGDGSQGMLVRLTEQLARSSPRSTEAASGAGDDIAAGAVWARIVGELFGAGDDPEAGDDP